MGTKLLLQSGAKSYFKVGQLLQPFISNWGKRYFKKGQIQLFQTGAATLKWSKMSIQSAAIISKWGKKLFQSEAASTTFYFKLGQALFQKGADTVISKWVKVCFKVEQKLFQSGAIISEWSITLTLHIIKNFKNNFKK